MTKHFTFLTFLFYILSLNALAVPRPITTDRPSRTDSAITVDKNQFQLEADWMNYTRLHKSGEYTAKIFPMNLKYGLSDKADLQLVFDTFLIQRSNNYLNRGHGDTTLRFKWNFIGNNGQKLALALLPFVKFPTSQDDLGNNAIEGGINLPWSYGLKWGFQFSSMLSVEFKRSTALDTRHIEMAYTANLNQGIFWDLSYYVEFWNKFSREDNAQAKASLDAGILWKYSDKTQFDIGGTYGLTDGTEQYNLFTGVSFKR